MHQINLEMSWLSYIPGDASYGNGFEDRAFGSGSSGRRARLISGDGGQEASHGGDTDAREFVQEGG